MAKPYLLSSAELIGQGIYFPSEVPHAISSEAVMHSFMVSPVYRLARMLSRDATHGLVFEVDNAAVAVLEKLAFTSDDCETVARIIDRRLLFLAGKDAQEEPLDHRIAEAVAIIDELETKRVAAGDLAEALALSESRFLHLFKDELKMTVRKYLLWRRTIDGARRVIEGSSVTEAAHTAGFTDSAHFARTFKQMFGFTVSGAFGGDPKPVLVVQSGV